MHFISAVAFGMSGVCYLTKLVLRCDFSRSNMSSGINCLNLHSLVGDKLFREQPTLATVVQNHECLRNANYAARPRPPQAAKAQN